MVFFQKILKYNSVYNRGKHTGLVGDIGIAKNLRTPLYNFAAVIDDEEMKISHVIRGDDHIANTPKQILLAQAFGFSGPIYAHLPMILNPDKSKMSKRYSATSVREYREKGYLAPALVNFMALLGWHPQNNTEKMQLLEIRKEFSLERVQKGGAIFDVQKLNWLNGEYIKELSDENLLAFLKNVYPLETKNLGIENSSALVKTLKPRMQTLKDFFNLQSELEFKDYPKQLLLWKNTPSEKTLEYLKWALDFIENRPNAKFEASELEKEIMPYANEHGRGEVLWPIRMALSGKEKSPGPFELMAVLGKKTSIERMQTAVKKLGE